MKFDVLNICLDVKEIQDNDLIVIQRKEDDRRILVRVVEVLNKRSNGDEEILLGKNYNDYFIWSMYMDGSSWVKRVWVVGKVELTNITNNMNEFPRG